LLTYHANNHAIFLTDKKKTERNISQEGWAWLAHLSAGAKVAALEKFCLLHSSKKHVGILIDHHAVVINIWLETVQIQPVGHARKIRLEPSEQAGGVRFELLGSAGDDPLGGVQDDDLQLQPPAVVPEISEEEE